MPNNTFIKLFHFLNADADGAANPGDTLDGGQNDSGDGYGPRGNKQDELQSI